MMDVRYRNAIIIQVRLCGCRFFTSLSLADQDRVIKSINDFFE